MKLFAAEESYNSTLTLESYLEYFNETTHISSESLSDYFYKILDSLNSVFDTVTMKYHDTDVKEITSYRLELLNKVKVLNFTEYSYIVLDKPENFKGKYIDYINKLEKTINEITPIVFESGKILKLAIADVVNNSNLDKVINIYGYSMLDKQLKQSEDLFDDIRKFFPLNNGSSKSTIREVFKTFNDIRPIIDTLESIDKIANREVIAKVKTLKNDVTELLDHTVKQLTENNTNDNDKVKKDLSKMVYSFSKIIEFYAYVLFDIKHFYKVFNSNVKTIIEL